MTAPILSPISSDDSMFVAVKNDHLDPEVTSKWNLHLTGSVNSGSHEAAQLWTLFTISVANKS